MVFAVRGFLLPNRLFYDQPRIFCSSQLGGKFSILQLEGFAVRGVSTVFDLKNERNEVMLMFVNFYAFGHGREQNAIHRNTHLNG